MKDFETILRECRKKSEQGATSESLVIYLYYKDINIVDSMKILREIYGISLGQAKTLVTSQPVWSKVVKGTEPLHDDLENVFRS